ncbi:hypothetical protein AJ78_07996 [Emergomyces pasteurianus Ep9510]|uniref:Uncharacterized protein n=1 Tax=Emergomyces pasteurianus Ep9510 TaxID=1447872 RepID=A0A1J9P4W2_9EURO|nr:hypothetical protein AJ78_07996 [Emergomyces pasteurianus Ep9510]
MKDEENILSSTQARWKDKGGDIIEFLLTTCDPTSIGPQGTTPLHGAVQLALSSTFELYLHAPLLGNLSVQNRKGKTTLHYATYFLPQEIGDLIEAGIDVHIRNRDGQSALDEARNNGCFVEDIRSLILQTEGKEALEEAKEQEEELPIYDITGCKIDKRIKRLFKAKTGNHGRIKSYNEPLWLNMIEPHDQVVAVALWLKCRRARVEVKFQSRHCRAWWTSPDAQNKVVMIFLHPGDTVSGLRTLKMKYIK